MRVRTLPPLSVARLVNLWSWRCIVSHFRFLDRTFICEPLGWTWDSVCVSWFIDPLNIDICLGLYIYSRCTWSAMYCKYLKTTIHQVWMFEATKHILHTVDGWIPDIPLFTWSFTSQVVQDFFHQQYECPFDGIWGRLTVPGWSWFLCSAVVFLFQFSTEPWKDYPKFQVGSLYISRKYRSEKTWKDETSLNQWTIGCTPNNVPMVLFWFCRDSWGL